MAISDVDDPRRIDESNRSAEVLETQPSAAAVPSDPLAVVPDGDGRLSADEQVILDEAAAAEEILFFDDLPYAEQIIDADASVVCPQAALVADTGEASSPVTVAEPARVHRAVSDDDGVADDGQIAVEDPEAIEAPAQVEQLARIEEQTTAEETRATPSSAEPPRRRRRLFRWPRRRRAQPTVAEATAGSTADRDEAAATSETREMQSEGLRPTAEVAGRDATVAPADLVSEADETFADAEPETEAVGPELEVHAAAEADPEAEHAAEGDVFEDERRVAVSRSFERPVIVEPSSERDHDTRIGSAVTAAFGRGYAMTPDKRKSDLSDGPRSEPRRRRRRGEGKSEGLEGTPAARSRSARFVSWPARREPGVDSTYDVADDTRHEPRGTASETDDDVLKTLTDLLANSVSREFDAAVREPSARYASSDVARPSRPTSERGERKSKLRPCSRCGEPSESVVCETCREAVAELRSLYR